jgi:hypothetical protein
MQEITPMPAINDGRHGAWLTSCAISLPVQGGVNVVCSNRNGLCKGRCWQKGILVIHGEEDFKNPGKPAILFPMMNSDSDERLFRLSTMRNLFSEMGRIAQGRQQTLEIAIYGGSALALCFDWRTSTADIDYMPVRGAEADIQEIAGIAARNLGLPEDGLRSDVQIFASDFAEIVQNGEYPAGMPDGFGLRVFTANPEYLLSMKMLSMRSSLETQDCRDVWHLIDEVGVKSADEALNYITRFYPNQQVPVRNVRILEDIFEAKQRGENYSATLGW